MQQCISDHSVHENPGASCENADSDLVSLWRGLRCCISSRLLGDADHVSADPTDSPSSPHGLEREVVWIVSCLCHEKAQCWWEGENEGGSGKPLAACRAGLLEHRSAPGQHPDPPRSLGWWPGSLSLPWRTLYFGFMKGRR